MRLMITVAVLFAALLGAHALEGAGSSAQEDVIVGCIDAFKSATGETASITYDPVGTGDGQDAILNMNVDFAAGDVPLTPSQTSGAGGTILQLPLAVGGINMYYNAPGLTGLQLDACTLAGIYQGDITSWDDPAIAALNPDLELPAIAPTPVARSDSSGSTELFSSYLAAACPSYRLGVGKTLAWPSVVVAVDGTSAVMSQVESTAGALGYANCGQDTSAAEVALATAAGDSTTCSGGNYANIADAVTVPGDASGDWSGVTLLYQPEPGAWPISFLGFLYTYQSPPEEGALLQSLLNYCLNEYQSNLPAGFEAVPANLATVAINGIGNIAAA